MHCLESIKLQLEHKVLYQLLKMFSWAAAIVATISQFSYQFRSRLISQLIKGISSVLQKLLRYCNGTIISTFTAWKVSQYGVISGPYLPVFGLNTEIYGPEITLHLDNFHAAIICAIVACLACSFFYFKQISNSISFSKIDNCIIST